MQGCLHFPLCELHEIWSTDQESHSNCCHEMSHFKAENAPNSISAGAPPQTLLGELTALPQTPSWI